MTDDYTATDHQLRDSDEYAAAKYRLTLRWLRDHPAGERLANVGCGGGLFNEMAAAAGFSVQGYEPDPAAFELALRNQPGGGCSIENLGLEQIRGRGIADVVVMHDVLEHIPDEATAVANLRRIVTADGTLVLSVPAIPALYGYHDEQLGHQRRYTRRALRAALEPHFTITRMRSFGFTLIPMTLYYSRWRRRAYPIADTGSPGVLNIVARAVCGAEERICAPIGTSLICEATPRADTPS